MIYLPQHRSDRRLARHLTLPASLFGALFVLACGSPPDTSTFPGASAGDVKVSDVAGTDVSVTDASDTADTNDQQDVTSDTSVSVDTSIADIVGDIEDAKDGSEEFDVTSLCDRPCLNGGTCIGPDRCECTRDWIGGDCSLHAPGLATINGQRLGRFKTGSPANEIGRSPAYEEQNTVLVNLGFEIMTTELMQAEWAALFDGLLPEGQSALGDKIPVANFTWWAALEAANALSITHGFKPCYALPAGPGCEGGPAAAGKGALFCPETEAPLILAPDGDILKCEGYRLPTEAEWELAARAGATTSLHDYSSHTANALVNNQMTCTAEEQPALSAIAWWCGNTSTAQPVASLASNPFGLFDVIGNVGEWTWDGFDPKVVSGTNPHRDQADSWASEIAGGHPPARTARGGSFADYPRELRLASRSPISVNGQYPQLGLRLVRSIR